MARRRRCDSDARYLAYIATRVSAEPEANIRGVVAARYNRGAPLRKPVTCSALPRAPPVRILHVYVYIHPRDGIIVTCSGEPRTRSSSTSNDRLSSGGDDTFLFSLPFHFHLFSILVRFDRVDGKIWSVGRRFPGGKLRMRRIVPISMPRK